MKKLTKTIVSLAIVATYAAIAAPSAVAEWVGSEINGQGTVSGTTMNPGAQTTIWNMTNMNIGQGEVGKINQYNGALTNVYARITGGKTTWNGKLDATGVNFAAFNDAGFFIGSSGVVNANALMLNTVNASSWSNDKILSGAWGGAQNADIVNQGNISADAVLLSGKHVINKVDYLTGDVPNKATGNIVGKTVRIAAGDNVNFNLDLSGVNSDPASNSIASLLVDPGLNIEATGDQGFIFNDGRILSTLERDADRPDNVGIGIHVSGKQSGNYQFDPDNIDAYIFDASYNSVDKPAFAFYNDYNSYDTQSGATPENTNFSQVATNGSNIVIEAAKGDVVDHGILSTVGDIKNAAMSDKTGYKINGLNYNEAGAVTGVAFGAKYAESSVKDSKLNLKLKNESDVKFFQKGNEACYEIKTGNIKLDVDGDYTIGPDSIIGDSHVTTIGTDPIVVDSTGTVTIDVDDQNPWDPGNDLQIIADEDIINNTPIQTDDKLIFDADRDIINNDPITVDGDGKLDWVAGRDIVNNDIITLDDQAGIDWKAGRNIVNNSKDDPYGDNPHSTAGDGTITGGEGSYLNFKTGVDGAGDPVDTYPDGGDIINKHQVTNGGTANWDAGRNVINDTTGTIDNPGTFNATSGNNPNATADANGNNGDIINRNVVNNPGTMAWDAGRNVINDTTGTIDNPGTFNATSGNKPALGDGDIINKHLIQNDGGAISLDAGRNVINDTTGVIQTKPGSTKNGTIQLTSGNKTPGDVINDGKIDLKKDSLKAVANAGNVINNGEFKSVSPNGTVDLEAKVGTGENAGKGGYVIQNGTVDLTNGGNLGDGNAVKFTAGKSIITTDAESYTALKNAGIKVRPDANGKRDPNGNAVTKIAPANNGILAKAADDIINNGITALKTNTGADMNLEATNGYIIQNNELAAKSGGKMKFKAGKDIITTDTNSRAKLKAAGVDPNSADLAYVSSSIVGSVADKNGNSITSLQTITPGDGSTPSMVLEAAHDVINNGITTIDAPDPNVKAGRHAIQNNILSFINPNKAKIEAGGTVQGDVIDGVGANRANIAGKSDFVSTNVVGDGSAKSITNIVATDEAATSELEMIAGNGGSVTTQGLINVDAKNATISTPSNDYNILGEINANTAFTLPDVDDPNVTYIFDNNSAYGSVDRARHPETTKGLLNLVAENNDINGNGANIHGYNVYIKAPSANGDINLANGTTAVADNIMSTYSNKLTVDDDSSLIGAYTQVHTIADMTLNGNTGSSFRLDRVAGTKELTVLSDGDVNVTGDTTLGDNSALNVADTSDKVTVAGTNVTVNQNAKLTLKTTADDSAGYVYAANKVDNKGTIDFAKGGKIAGDTVDVSGKVKAGKDLGIFSKKGQNHTGANLEAENILLQTDAGVDFTATNKADFHSGFIAAEGENYSNTLNLTDTKVNATTGYLHMYAGDITASDATKAEATQFASAGETVMDAKSGALNITNKIVKAGNGLIGKAKTTVDVNNSNLTATAGDIALTAGGKATVKGGSMVDTQAGKTTVTGVGVEVNASEVKASDLNTLEAGTGDLILDGATATGGSLIGHGKNVISQNNKSTLKATAEDGTIDLTADSDVTFNKDVDFDAPTTNINAEAGTITNNTNLAFTGDAILTAKNASFTNGSKAIADSGLLKVVTSGDGDTQKYVNSTMTAKDIYLKAESGNIALDGTTPIAEDHMSTRSNTISFANGAKVKGDKTVVSTISNLNVASNVDKIVGTSELTMHSDNDVIVDGDVTLKSNNKATLAAGHDVRVESGKTITFATPNGYVNAGNAVDNAGNVVFNNDGQVAGKTVNVNNGSIKAGNDLAIYSKEDQGYVAADLEAGRNVRLQTDTPVSLTTNEDAGYLQVVQGDPTAPNAYAHNININGKTVKAGTGDLNMAAKDINLGNVEATAGNRINLDAGQDLIFDNAVVTAEGKNLPTTGDRDAVVGLAGRDVYLKGGNTKITAKDGNLVLKADSGHYGATLADGTADRSPNATGGVIFNQTGKGLMDTLYTTQNSDETWKGYWNIFSNDEETADGAERKAAAQALKDDITLYEYDKNKPDYRSENNRTIFYDDRRNKADEKGQDPYKRKPSPTPPTQTNFDDSRLIQSVVEQPEEKTVWKRFDNHVDQTKMEVNSSVNRYVQSGDQYIDSLGQPMINGVSEVQKDVQVGYYDDEE